jgi:hypothetical protein
VALRRRLSDKDKERRLVRRSSSKRKDKENGGATDKSAQVPLPLIKNFLPDNLILAVLWKRKNCSDSLYKVFLLKSKNAHKRISRNRSYIVDTGTYYTYVNNVGNYRYGSLNTTQVSAKLKSCLV